MNGGASVQPSSGLVEGEECLQLDCLFLFPVLVVAGVAGGFQVSTSCLVAAEAVEGVLHGLVHLVVVVVAAEGAGFLYALQEVVAAEEGEGALRVPASEEEAGEAGEEEELPRPRYSAWVVGVEREVEVAARSLSLLVVEGLAVEVAEEEGVHHLPTVGPLEGAVEEGLQNQLTGLAEEGRAVAEEAEGAALHLSAEEEAGVEEGEVAGLLLIYGEALVVGAAEVGGLLLTYDMELGAEVVVEGWTLLTYRKGQAEAEVRAAAGPLLCDAEGWGKEEGEAGG
eukprot:SM000029S10562  [mRNA]  locus=s29:876048:877161:+ [translate_table: standard]